LAHWILLVVGEDDHVLTLIAKVLAQIRRHIPNIVDASSQLTALAKVVDAYQERFPPAGALGILEGVPLWCSIPKVLRGLWWRGWSVMISMNV